MYNVYQHWDPLKVCVVGRSYPPEFYSWIKVPHVRQLFEKIAIETEEDYQNIIKKLSEFGVQVLRPDLSANNRLMVNGRWVPPPMTPRDYTVMIGNKFYSNIDTPSTRFQFFYNSVKDKQWPDCHSIQEFESLPVHIQTECIDVHKIHNYVDFDSDPKYFGWYHDIIELIQQQGNQIDFRCHSGVNGAMVTRIGKDLYFGTEDYNQPLDEYREFINSEFVDTRNHIVNTGGHSDGSYCPVTPGLIVSLKDIPTYKDTFPGWEVVYLENQSWGKVRPFLDLKEKNHGKWWIPGFEYDNSVIEVVETWLKHWTGYVEETVFDVNMLIVDPKNVIVFNYNKTVFDAFDRYGITPHIVPFRHRYFWDGGIHCLTSDLHREGTMQDFFPNRS